MEELAWGTLVLTGILAVSAVAGNIFQFKTLERQELASRELLKQQRSDNEARIEKQDSVIAERDKSLSRMLRALVLSVGKSTDYLTLEAGSSKPGNMTSEQALLSRVIASQKSTVEILYGIMNAITKVDNLPGSADAFIQTARVEQHEIEAAVRTKLKKSQEISLPPQNGLS